MINQRRQSRFLPNLWLFSLVLALLLALAGCQLTIDEREVLAEGEEVYLANCSRCHEMDGQGFADVYPPLAGNPIVMLHDPVPALEIIIEGRHAMPGFADMLTREEIAAVTTYIRNEWGNDASLVMPRQVRAGVMPEDDEEEEEADEAEEGDESLQAEQEETE
jgi:mono/diheme cytochrome c family protein